MWHRCEVTICSILQRFTVTFHPPGSETDVIMTSDDDGLSMLGRSPRRGHPENPGEHGAGNAVIHACN